MGVARALLDSRPLQDNTENGIGFHFLGKRACASRSHLRDQWKSGLKMKITENFLLLFPQVHPKRYFDNLKGAVFSHEHPK